MEKLFGLSVSWRYFFFIFLCTLYAGVCFVLVDFIDNPLDGVVNVLTVGMYWCVVCVAIYLMLYVAALSKVFFAIFFPLFSTLGAIVAYYRYAFKATLTPMLLDAVLNNDMRTSLDVITPALLLVILLSVVVSFVVVKVRWRDVPQLKFAYIHAVGGVVLLLFYMNVHPRIYSGVCQRYPYNVYYNVKLYDELRVDVAKLRVNPVSEYSRPLQDSLLVIFVLGESLRADHLSLNGYDRETTPRLALEPNVISLPNIYSEYTHTVRSVPHILTRADSANVDLAFVETSFVSVFDSCGFYTAWLGNQDPAKSYISFMKECDTVGYVNPEKSVYLYDEWLDIDLVEGLGGILGNWQGDNSLFILHTIGSHWYYDSHYTDEFERFVPTASSRVIGQNDSLAIVNSYDNTVLYADYVLSELIQLVRHEKAIVIYLSDHGECLGEDGQWLHANDHQAIKNPACIVWYSNRYAQDFSREVESLRANRCRSYRTDFLYYSVLTAAGIEFDVREASLDVFSCTD